MAKDTTKELKALRDANKQKLFEQAVLSLNKDMQSVTKDKSEVEASLLGDNIQADVELISSGSLVLDQIAGGGIPKGRIIEIYGPESSGKTSIALNAIASVQRAGGNAFFFDVEQALDPGYARILGVDTERLGFSQQSVAEYILLMVRKLLSTQSVDIIVIDSLASMIPLDEFKDPDKHTMGLMARIMSKHLRYLATLARQSNCTIIFLNQIREKVGVVFGNPETTPGGKALKFFASQRIEVRRKGQVKDGTDVIGTEVRLKIVKNKIGAPFQEGVTVLTFKEGINRAAEMLTIGEELDIIKLSGRTYSVPKPTRHVELTGDIATYEDNGSIKVATSKSNAILALREEEDLFGYLSEILVQKLAAKREGTVLTEKKALEDKVDGEFAELEDLDLLD